MFWIIDGITRERGNNTWKMEVSEGEYSSIFDIKRELHDELLLAENYENEDDGINAELENIILGLEYITKKLSNSI